MNLFTSSSNFTRTPKALLVFLALNAAAGLAVLAVPWTGAGWFLDFTIREAGRDPREILILGDSKVFPFVEGYIDCPFFSGPAYAFAMDSATVLFQRLWYDRLVRETGIKPKVVIYSTGANNFNENGLHALRDYTVRYVAETGDLLDYWKMDGAFPYLVDALLCRLYPIYGMRIEITHLMFRGYKPRQLDLSPVVRDPVADENYLLIYKRGVLASYQVSDFHMNNLVRWSEEIRAHGGELVVVDLPVTPEMREMELRECREWDERIAAFSRETGISYLDLREHSELPFRDINHLTNMGAKEVAERWLDPIAREILSRAETGINR